MKKLARDINDGQPLSDETGSVAELAEAVDEALSPDMEITAVMSRFGDAQRDELAVVDQHGHVIGPLTKAHVRRRYGEELEKAQRELFGEA